MLKILIERNEKVIGDRIAVADSFLSRLQGLMFKAELADGEGLLIKPCSSIHMMFMRFPIDAIFMDAGNRVKALYKKLAPWTGLTKWHREATSVLELKSGTIDKSGVELNDKLILEQV